PGAAPQELQLEIYPDETGNSSGAGSGWPLIRAGHFAYRCPAAEGRKVRRDNECSANIFRAVRLALAGTESSGSASFHVSVCSQDNLEVRPQSRPSQVRLQRELFLAVQDLPDDTTLTQRLESIPANRTSMMPEVRAGSLALGPKHRWTCGSKAVANP